MTQTVLVVGATGMLGNRIAHYLLEQPDTDVRLLVRQSGLNDAAKKALLSPLLDRGAQIAQGDLADRASLDRATMGVRVIVSAVQGGPDAIVDGQIALLQSARTNGVRRILPSDFAVDLFRAPEGEHPFFDARRKADTTIQASGLEYVHVLNGAFMDNFLNSKFSPVFDRAKGTASFWGEGDELFDATSVEDTARYTAKAAVDPALPSGKFAVAGQQLSFRGIIQTVEQVESRAFTRVRRGSVADLRAWIADKRGSNPDPMAWIAGLYQLYMLTGQTALTDLQNDRYPDIHPESFADYARRTLATRQAA